MFKWLSSLFTKNVVSVPQTTVLEELKELSISETVIEASKSETSDDVKNVDTLNEKEENITIVKHIVKLKEKEDHGAFFHTRNRYKERYGNNLGFERYNFWIKKIQQQDSNFAVNIGIRPDKDAELWMIFEKRGERVYVVYKDGVILTALPPNSSMTHLGDAKCVLMGKSLTLKNGKTSSKSFQKLEKKIIGSYKQRVEKSAAVAKNNEKNMLLKKAAIDFSQSECS